jgi:hypothetical protein
MGLPSTDVGKETAMAELGAGRAATPNIGGRGLGAAQRRRTGDQRTTPRRERRRAIGDDRRQATGRGAGLRW